MIIQQTHTHTYQLGFDGNVNLVLLEQVAYVSK